MHNKKQSDYAEYRLAYAHALHELNPDKFSKPVKTKKAKSNRAKIPPDALIPMKDTMARESM